MVFHNRDAPLDDDLDTDLSAFVPGWSSQSDPFNLDVDCPLPPETDLLGQFSSSDLEIPMLLDDPPNYASEDSCPNYLLDPILSGLEDASEWDPEAFPNLKSASNDPAVLLAEIKEEIKVEPDFPPSPPPSSAGSTSSLCNIELWPADGSTRAPEEGKTILESPPLSPPFGEDNSPPESPQIISEVLHNGSCVTIPSSPLTPPSPANSETVVKIVPCSFKLKSGKKVALAQRPAPFIKPKPSAEQPLAEVQNSPAGKTAAPTVKAVTLPASVPAVGDKRKTIVLSAKDFAALTQKVRGNQASCAINVLNGTKAVPTTLRLQASKPTPSVPPNPTIVPPIAVTSTGQTSVPTYAQVITPNAVPGKVPLIPCQTITNSIPAVATIPVTSSAVRPLQSTAFSGQKVTSNNPVRREMEMKALKRQQRMIKNRESACLSRKKKKEYVSSLEGRLSELEQENVQLKLENDMLRERLGELENAMSWTKAPSFSVKTKKATAVLAVLLMVSLNFGSFTTMLNRDGNTLSMGGANLDGGLGSAGRHGRLGRSLLWTPNLDLPLNNDSKQDFPSKNSSGSATAQPICPLFINQTESIRLDSELRRWIGSEPDSPSDSPPTFYSKHDNGFRNNATQNDEFSKEKPLLDEAARTATHITALPQMLPDVDKSSKDKRRKLRRKTFGHRASKKSPSASNEVEVYGVRSPLYDYTAFLDSFQRRDDTFYVVSFSGDHILLPAQAHNTSSRPKMSLVLPAVPINKSMFGLNHIRMMQIDCEVTNTQMLRVRQDDIPAHVRPTAAERFPNMTSGSSNTPAANDSSSADIPQRNVASSQAHNNLSRTDQNTAPAPHPTYKPYFMKSGYPEKLPLSASQVQQLKAAFLKNGSETSPDPKNNSTLAVESKPVKVLNYP